MKVLKGTKAYSVFKNKCPKCHEGGYFESKNPYNFKTLGKMPDRCLSCGQSFVIENGFYVGAMFVSYAIGAAIFITLWVATSVLFPSLTYWNQVVIEAIGIVVLFPVNFWLSRLIWININIHYDVNFNQKLHTK